VQDKAFDQRPVWLLLLFCRLLVAILKLELACSLFYTFQNGGFQRFLDVFATCHLLGDVSSSFYEIFYGCLAILFLKIQTVATQETDHMMN